MRYNIYKGGRPSEGAQNLRAALNGIILRASGSTYTGRGDRALINWGSSNAEARRLWEVANPEQRLNNPAAVNVAGNKLTSLRLLNQRQVPIMPFWERGNHQEVLDYVKNGGRVYARGELRGHSGSGITVIMHRADRQVDEVLNRDNGNRFSLFLVDGTTGLSSIENTFNQVELFTQGIQGVRREWRIHVFRRQPILAQLKLRSRDHFSGSNSLIRNLDNGWIYSVNFERSKFPEVQQMEQLAVQAVQALGLDFGAVDLIYRPRSSTRNEQSCVLEVNTAPGLEEGASTLRVYTEAIQAWGAGLDAQRVQAR